MMHRPDQGPFGIVLAAAALALLLIGGGQPANAGAGVEVGIDHDGAPADINAGPAEISAGGSLTVSVIADTGTAEVGAWNVDVFYDPTVLQVESCSAPPSGACNPQYSPMVVRTVGASAFGESGVLNLVDVTFSPIAEEGFCSLLTVSARELYDGIGTPLPASVSNGSACVTSGDGVSLAWGDADCDDGISTRDNQALLRRILQQNPLSQTEPCPDIGSTLTVVGLGSRLWGDLDCDGEITTRDNQAELRRVLQQTPLSQTEPCPDIGATVTLN